MSILKREKLILPQGHDSLLLHACCAPCCGEIIETLIFSEIDFSIFFYNPNIHPLEEYEMRKAEIIRFCKKKNVPFYDGDYDTDNWFVRAKGLEKEPERGLRCSMCFDVRFERTALFAYEKRFRLFSTSLGISRCKNIVQVNESGYRAAAAYDDLTYWDYNWRKRGGSERMAEVCRCECFYKQGYCGCIFSLHQANKWRKEKGKPLIEFSTLECPIKNA